MICRLTPAREASIEKFGLPMPDSNLNHLGTPLSGIFSSVGVLSEEESSAENAKDLEAIVAKTTDERESTGSIAEEKHDTACRKLKSKSECLFWHVTMDNGFKTVEEASTCIIWPMFRFKINPTLASQTETLIAFQDR